MNPNIRPSLGFVKLRFLILLIITIWFLIFDCRSSYFEEDYDLIEESFDNECRGAKENLFEFMGSYTPYRYRFNSNDNEIIIKGCTPIKIFILLRHGSKYPTYNTTIRHKFYMTGLFDVMRRHMGEGTTCRTELFKIYEFNWNKIIPPYSYGTLSQLGEEEINYFAHRLRKRFPKLFNDVPSGKYQFKFLKTDLDRKSLRAFIFGLFDERVLDSITEPGPTFEEPLLLFDKTCKKWYKQIKHNPETYEPLKKFAETNEMKDVLNQVASRIGLRTNCGQIEPYVNNNLIQFMYQICKWHTAIDINFEKSPLCNAFSEKSAQTMEYLNDLRTSILHGYSHELNVKIACYLFGYIIRSLKTSDSNVFLFFVKSGIMVKILTHLGLFKDPYTINHNNFDSMKDRRWKMSQINPQVANLIFVLYNCTKMKKIQIMHLERAIHIPGCAHTSTDDHLCPFDVFQAVYNSSLNDCNMNKLCKINKSDATIPTIKTTTKYIDFDPEL